MPALGQPLLSSAGGSNEQPAAQEPAPPFKWRSTRGCLAGCGLFWLLLLLLVASLQVFLYQFGMGFSCGPNHLEHYDFPGGGRTELVEEEVILTVDGRSRWGWSAEVYPAREGRKTGAASTGKVWRTWGPLWYTYAYMDNQGKYTFVARDRPIAVGGSHWLFRCDQAGAPYVYNVGGNFISNELHYLLGTQISSHYNIWEGGYWKGTKVATVARAGGLGADANSQLIFNRVGSDRRFANGNLLQTNHNNHKEWYVKNDELAKNSSERVPYWVPTMITSIFAIHLDEKFKSHAQPADEPPEQSLLIELGNRSEALGPSVVEQPVAPPPEDVAANQAFLPWGRVGPRGGG